MQHFYWSFLKKCALFSILFLLLQQANAQEPIQDFFHQLDAQNKEQLESVISEASAELDLQFYTITHSQSSPHVPDNMRAIAEASTQSVFLIINIYDQGISFGTVLVSDDLEST